MHALRVLLHPKHRPQPPGGLQGSQPRASPGALNDALPRSRHAQAAAMAYVAVTSQETVTDGVSSRQSHTLCLWPLALMAPPSARMGAHHPLCTGMPGPR